MSILEDLDPEYAKTRSRKGNDRFRALAVFGALSMLVIAAFTWFVSAVEREGGRGAPRSSRPEAVEMKTAAAAKPAIAPGTDQSAPAVAEPRGAQIVDAPENRQAPEITNSASASAPAPAPAENTGKITKPQVAEKRPQAIAEASKPVLTKNASSETRPPEAVASVVAKKGDDRDVAIINAMMR